MRFNLVILSLLFLTGCFRGSKFETSPIHLNPNMDNQHGSVHPTLHLSRMEYVELLTYYLS